MHLCSIMQLPGEADGQAMAGPMHEGLGDDQPGVCSDYWTKLHLQWDSWGLPEGVGGKTGASWEVPSWENHISAETGTVTRSLLRSSMFTAHCAGNETPESFWCLGSLLGHKAHRESKGKGPASLTEWNGEVTQMADEPGVSGSCLASRTRPHVAWPLPELEQCSSPGQKPLC